MSKIWYPYCAYQDISHCIETKRLIEKAIMQDHHKIDGVVKTSIYCVVAFFSTLDIPYVCLRTEKNTTPRSLATRAYLYICVFT